MRRVQKLPRLKLKRRRRYFMTYAAAEEKDEKKIRSAEEIAFINGKI
jgi:hypothetical protein